jgi:hypothetical protein
MVKPTTRMHEVYNPTFRLIPFCGSLSACQRYVSNKPDSSLVIRPAGR